MTPCNSLQKCIELYKPPRNTNVNMWKLDFDKIFQQSVDGDFNMSFIPDPEFQEELSILVGPSHFSELYI